MTPPNIYLNNFSACSALEITVASAALLAALRITFTFKSEPNNSLPGTIPYVLNDKSFGLTCLYALTDSNNNSDISFVVAVEESKITCIFLLNPNSENAGLYFSNPLANVTYACLKSLCNTGLFPD